MYFRLSYALLIRQALSDKEVKMTAGTRVRFLLFVGILGFTCFLNGASSSIAHAATLTLGSCNGAELISAIHTANANSGADTIELKPSCVYSLTGVENNGGQGPNG